MILSFLRMSVLQFSPCLEKSLFQVKCDSKLRKKNLKQPYKNSKQCIRFLKKSKQKSSHCNILKNKETISATDLTPSHKFLLANYLRVFESRYILETFYLYK